MFIVRDLLNYLVSEITLNRFFFTKSIARSERNRETKGSKLTRCQLLLPLRNNWLVFSK
jgi:hypothetical protein